MRSLLPIMAGAIVALALWPVLRADRAPAATVTPAPLTRDYLLRDRLVAFYERQARNAPTDQITMRMLASQYLQRFREQYDLGDVARAEALARRSIELQPQGNTPAQMALAGALLTYHHFRQALVHERDAWMGEPSNHIALAQIASLQMELGEYDVARRTLAQIGPLSTENPAIDAVRARYDELTGNLAEARELIDRGGRTMDSDVGSAAFDRSWFHMRAAQLAFEAGDLAQSQEQFTVALTDFPDNAMALMFQAQLQLSQHRWRAALDSARAASALYPLPQALGYEVDADLALGDKAGAAQTDALISAEQRLFDAQGINDRLLANYYAEHDEHLEEALRAARSDYLKRGNEIYADDTLGWVLARMGRWEQASLFTQRALRTGSRDPLLHYHAAIVDLHTGRTAQGCVELRGALRVDPGLEGSAASQPGAACT